MKQFYLDFYDRYGVILVPLLIGCYLLLEIITGHSKVNHILPIFAVIIDLPAQLIYKELLRAILNISVLLLTIGILLV